MNQLPLQTLPEFATNMQPDTPCNSFLTSIYQKERLFFMLRFGLAYVEEEGKDGQRQLQKHMTRCMVCLKVPMRSEYSLVKLIINIY